MQSKFGIYWEMHSKFFRFWHIKSRWFDQLGYNLADLLYGTLVVQHHGVVNSEILDLAFIAFWNQTLYLSLNSYYLHPKVYRPVCTGSIFLSTGGNLQLIKVVLSDGIGILPPICAWPPPGCTI
jgi:hypothetical protein